MVADWVSFYATTQKLMSRSMPLNHIFRFAALWVTAMAWHLLRILTLRPAFSHVSDTRAPLYSFASVYLACGVLRWAVMDDKGIFTTVTVLAFNALFLAAMTVRSDRSMSLFMVMLGASAAVDVTALVGQGLGLDVQSFRYQLLALELAVMCCAAIRFSKLPDYMRATGFQPTPQPEGKAARN